MNKTAPLNNKILLSLSGGLDSSTLLGHLLDLGHEVVCSSFNYGSKHNKYENKAAQDIANYYNVPITWINLVEVMRSFKSNLLLSGGDIPEGHYEDESMSKTVVPFRNGIFLSIMAGLAESIEASQVAVGIHKGDHHIYPDCRVSFFSNMNGAIKEGTDGKVRMMAPFIFMDKTDILRKGMNLSIPYHLTRTCYKDQPVSCGLCGSCVERLESFNTLGFTDPISYSQEIK